MLDSSSSPPHVVLPCHYVQRKGSLMLSTTTCAFLSFFFLMASLLHIPSSMSIGAVTLAPRARIKHRGKRQGSIMVMMKDLSLARSMNARTLGSGRETLVLAHGYGADQSIWDHILPQLSSRYTIVVFDWCFAGTVADQTIYDPIRHSSYDGFADDLICLLEEMNLKSPVFVGHSMSGMIGCIASVKKPKLFQTIILVGATPRILNAEAEGYEGGFDLSKVEAIFSSIDSNFDGWVSVFAASVVDGPGSESTCKFEKCLKNMRPHQVALPLAKTVFLSDYRDILDNVVTPCHIIQTTNDAVVPNSVPRYMQKRIKGNCEIHCIETEGHFPQLTAHTQFVELIQKIVET